LFLLLILLFHGQINQFKEFFVFDFVFGFEKSFIKGKPSQSSCFAFGDHHRDFELSNNCAWLLNDDWVRNEELVIETFFETEASDIGIFETVQAETK
jgi:hypothetical protein